MTRNSPGRPACVTRYLPLVLCALTAATCANEISAAGASPGSEESVRINNTLAFDLLDRVSGKDQNFVYSPYGVISALLPIYNGAAGRTEEEMRTALGISRSTADLNASYAALAAHVQASARRDSAQLNNTTSFWIRREAHLTHAYRALAAAFYSTDLQSVDFANNALAVANSVNEYVSSRTNKRIGGLVSSGEISEGTRFMVMSAAYFGARWEAPFDPAMTVPGTFRTNANDSVRCHFMCKQFGLADHFENDSIQVVALPYKGDDFAALIALPRTGIALTGIESWFSPRAFAARVSSLKPGTVNVVVPRFSIGSHLDPREYLTTKGMRLAFGADGDFSRMSPKEKLFISYVRHGAFLGVDESGTEAGAAMAVAMKTAFPLSELEKIPRFKADHPFVFAIYHRPTHALLFVAKVCNPAQG